MLSFLIDHFTVVCPVTWPFNGNKAGGDIALIWYRPLCFCHVNAPDKNKNNLIYITIAVRSVSKEGHLQPRCMPFKGQVTEQTTVKWSTIQGIKVICLLCALQPIVHAVIILSLPDPKTTIYGLHSFSYLAAKLWNSLPESLRTLSERFYSMTVFSSIATFL